MDKTIAYLAPEIPSLSATFVYNEILALESKGVKIVPISVHYPVIISQEAAVQRFLKDAVFLYCQKPVSVLRDNLAIFLQRPDRYLKTLLTAIGDILRAGLTKTSSFKLLYQFWQASTVAQAISHHSCQHLHIHFAHVPTQIGMYAAALSGVPFTFTAHANDLFERGLLLKEKVQRSKAAITISQYNCDFLVAQGADSKKLKIVRCGVETDKYEFTHRQQNSRIPILGSLGRLVEKKGMDTLLLALSKLHQQGIDFQLEICGDGPLRNSLQALIQQLGLESKTKFRGAIAHNEVFAWLKSLDAFVLACKQDSNGDQDGIPVVLMEAMAVGTPVITTQISGIPELVENEISGFLAQPGDPESLATAIQKAINGSYSLAKMTETARQQVTQEFDSHLNVNRLLSIFN
jgi:glycosyltransferase involved in cell wall biosynthesis